jgi:alkylated DNA repair dioxygenase AlkB
MVVEPHRGAEPIEVPGFSYLPRFITQEESEALLRYFGSLKPLWESRHVGGRAMREGQTHRRLTRPVYWLGAWQFACLGYYTEPNHLEEKCLRAEPMAPELQRVLERLRPKLAEHQSDVLPNTCLINYYGSELTKDAKGRTQPVDYARLKMHRDGEPGPVVMFSLGQPALFEFVDGARPDEPERSVWLANRSVVIFSGPHFKDHLYHRVVRVRHGDSPVMPQVLDDFRLRRVSVSFRFVPEQHIKSLNEFSAGAQSQIRGYVEQLAQSSEHFKKQLT